MTYSIGQVAEMFDLPISTLRYYDKEGLFPSLERKSGIRKFSEVEIDALRVIECLKGSGLEIKDIKQFMDWCTQGPETYVQRKELFERRLDALEEEMTDVLGEVYMATDLGSKSTGQFFTPFHLSELCAKMALPHWEKEYSEHGTISLNEPSCGGGGMIIAAAKVMRDAGINPQRALNVVAQDLDWKGVYMTYLQLSLLGIRAKVVQGDTLADPYRAGYPPERILRTPRDMGVLL